MEKMTSIEEPEAPRQVPMEEIMVQMIQEYKRDLVSHLKASRPPMEALSSGPKRDLERDRRLLEDTKRKFARVEGGEPTPGELGEALVLSRLERGALGSDIIARPSTEFDDVFKGVDIELDHMQMREPVVSSIDVTLNQNVENGHHVSERGEGKNGRDGLTKKLERVRGRIDHVASLSPEEARVLSAWIASGGMGEGFSKENSELFKAAEKVVMIKYYDAPEGHPLHGRPHPVIAGPQIVLSLDQTLVQRAVTDPLRAPDHERVLDAIIATETALALRAYGQYVGKVIKERGANALLEQIWVATRAWEQALARESSHEKVSSAQHFVRQNAEALAQVTGFQEALKKAFSEKK